MPKSPSPSLPPLPLAQKGPARASVPAPQQSPLRSYRPDYVPPPTLPPGTPEDRFATWFHPSKDLPPPAVQTMPKRWELAFPTQLRDWRQRSARLQQQSNRFDHGMIPGQTWLLHVPIPEGEAVHLDTSEEVKQQTLQGARQRLLLVCMPPQVILQEGNRIAVSDPRDLERPVNASRMPQEVLTVPAGPRLLLAHELDSLAWAACEDREAVVGELLD